MGDDLFLCLRADARPKPRETGWRSDACSPLRAGSGKSNGKAAMCRGRREPRLWQHKRVCALWRRSKRSRRGQVGDPTGLRGVGAVPTPCDNVHHDRCRPELPLRDTFGLSSVPGSPAPLRVGSNVVSLAPLVGGSPVNAASAKLDFLVGRVTSGRPPPWCPQGGLLPAGTRWTLLS